MTRDWKLIVAAWALAWAAIIAAGFAIANCARASAGAVGSVHA